MYTLEAPTPYFLSGLTYTPWFPAYGPLLDELGKDFGTSNDKLYYCGAYILAEYEPQVKHKYVKNYNNWDADKIYITEINRRYNAEAATLAPNMVLRGEIDYADISTDIVDDWKANNPQYLSKKRLDTMWSYFYCFNFNPTYDASYKPEDWLKAVNNENFRHSIMSAFDRAYAIRAFEPDDPSPSCRPPSPLRPSAPMEPPISPVSPPWRTTRRRICSSTPTRHWNTRRLPWKSFPLRA